MAYTKNPPETIRRIADAVDRGEMSKGGGAKQLGITWSALRGWMQRHGYPGDVRYDMRVNPTERDIKALQEYWRRDCNLQDLKEYTGRSYAVVRRWINEGIGKE